MSVKFASKIDVADTEEDATDGDQTPGTPLPHTETKLYSSDGSMKKAAILALLGLLLCFNFGCGYIFSKLELRREMRAARRERIDSLTAAVMCTELSRKQYCDFLLARVEAAADVDARCGMCAPSPEQVALEEIFYNLESDALDWDSGALAAGLAVANDAIASMRAVYKRICARETHHCKWDPVGAGYFAFTVYTTIGFGDFAPRTTGGRFFVVFVVIFGMGIAFAFFGALGEKIYIALRRHFGFVERHKAKVYAALVTAYVLGGGLYFYALGLLQASPSFGDAVYYCVVTISTLGLGDELPRVAALPLLSTYVYAIGGIALASAAIQALAEDWAEAIARRAFAVKHASLAKRLSATVVSIVSRRLS